MQLAPFGQLFKSSWELYKKKLSILAMLFAVPFVLSYIYAIIVNHSAAIKSLHELGATSRPVFVSLGAPATILLLVLIAVSLWIQVATVYVIDAPDDKHVMADLLVKAWNLVGPYLWVTILAGLAVIGGMFLLIVPGIIFAIWFSFSTYTTILDGQRGTSALKASKALVNGRFGAVLGRFALLLLVFIGATIVVGLIGALLPPLVHEIVTSAFSSFLISPLAVIFSYLLYKDLKAKGAVQAVAPQAPVAPPAVVPPAAPQA